MKIRKKIYINNENKTNSNVHRDSHALSELFMAKRQIQRERERYEYERCKTFYS